MCPMMMCVGLWHASHQMAEGENPEHVTSVLFAMLLGVTSATGLGNPLLVWARAVSSDLLDAV